MSTVAAKIRAAIKNIGPGIEFTTGDLLHCGSRNAVDLQLSELVRQKTILRLTRGVFVVPSAEMEIPSAIEIARAKARRFGKNLIEVRSLEKEETVFLTDGCNSSFQTAYGRLRFKHNSPRQLTRQKDSITHSKTERDRPNAAQQTDSNHFENIELYLRAPALEQALAKMAVHVSRFLLLFAAKVELHNGEQLSAGTALRKKPSTNS